MLQNTYQPISTRSSDDEEDQQDKQESSTTADYNVVPSHPSSYSFLFSTRNIPDNVEFRPALEGIRGVAICLVLLCHTSDIFHVAFYRFAGAAGVSIFFVLSGFLITGILKKNQNQTKRMKMYSHIGWFYLDRAVRLLPALIPLFLYMVYRSNWRKDKREDIIVWMLRGLLSLENQYWILPKLNSPIEHFWSLSCEEQFYFGWSLILPLICAISSVRYRGAAIAILLGFFTYVAIYSAMYNNSFYMMDPYKGPLVNVYKLLLGSILRLLPLPEVFFHRRAAYFAYTGILATTIAVLSTSTFGFQYWGPGIVCCFTTLIITASLDNGDSFLELSLLRYFGRISYAFYIWHFTILRYDGTLFMRREGLYSCAVAFCLSSFSTFYYEEPLRALYARYKARRKAAPVSVSVA